MRSAKSYAYRPSSKPRSTCEDLRRLKARIEAARGKARNLYMATVKATDAASLPNLEEVKQTSSALKMTLLRSRDHLTNQHSQTRGDRLAV